MSTFNAEAKLAELKSEGGFHGFGLGLGAHTREMGVEVWAQAPAGVALEGAGGMKGGKAGVVLSQPFCGQVPGLAHVEVVGVVVELDYVDAVGTRADVLGAGNEDEAKLKVVAVAAEIIVEHIVAVEALGHDVVGRLKEVVDEERATGALGRMGEGGEGGIPLGVGFIGAGEGGRHSFSVLDLSRTPYTEL